MNTYTIAYNANGGSGTMADTTGVKYGVATTLRSNTFTRTGYTFAGWSTSTTGDKMYTDGQSVSNLSATNGATVNLYAVWYDYVLQPGTTFRNNISSSITKIVFTDQDAPSGVTLTDVSANQNGSVIAWTSGTTMYVSTRTSGTKVIANESCQAMFAGFTNLTEIDFSNLDTSNVTSMNSMFGGCSGLTKLDLSGFNTSSVTNMGSMFSACSNLETIFVSELFSVSSVTSSSSMFGSCPKLVGCAGTVYDNSHTDKAYAIVDQGKSNPGYFTIEDILLKGIDFRFALGDGSSTVTKLVFTDIKAPTGASLTDVSALHNGSVVAWTAGDTRYVSTQRTGKKVYANKDCEEMFESRTFTEMDFSNFDTTYVKNMKKMFYGAYNVTSLDLSGFNTSNVENMNNTFYGCTRLTKFNLSGWDTSSVTDMDHMFYMCSTLPELDISDFDTSSVTTMNYMFAQCNRVVMIIVGDGFVVGSSTTGNDMFYDARCLVGGAGTVYDSTKIDKTYAHIDGGTSNPGYFTGQIFLEDGMTFNSDIRSNFINNDEYEISDLRFETVAPTNAYDGLYIDVSKNKDEAIIAWVDSYTIKVAPRDEGYQIFANDSSRHMFQDLSLMGIYLYNFDTSYVTDMYSMFNNCQTGIIKGLRKL